MKHIYVFTLRAAETDGLYSDIPMFRRKVSSDRPLSPDEIQAHKDGMERAARKKSPLYHCSDVRHSAK